MNPEVAKAALAFLARTDLKGNEAHVMVQVIQALSDVITSSSDKVSNRSAEPTVPE